MTEALLPPDATRDGWYWVHRIGNPNDVHAWHWNSGKWTCVYTISPERAGLGWLLASPHPIPKPEKLDALHALPDAMVKAQREVPPEGPCVSDYIRMNWILAGQECADMLRDALKGKP